LLSADRSVERFGPPRLFDSSATGPLGEIFAGALSFGGGGAGEAGAAGFIEDGFCPPPRPYPKPSGARAALRRGARIP
jgi:hypothetical protein